LLRDQRHALRVGHRGLRHRPRLRRLPVRRVRPALRGGGAQAPAHAGRAARAHGRTTGTRARPRAVPRPRARARGRLVRDRARDRRALAPGVPAPMTAIAIDGARMLADLDELSAIGRRGRGVHRPAYTEDDVRAREWLAGRLADAGLDAEI